MKISRAKTASVGDGKRHGRHRVPEIVDAAGNADLALHRRDHGRHGRKAFRRGLQQVGAVAFVAEHDRVDAAVLQSLQIPGDMVDDGLNPAVRIVERRAGQRQQVGHGDDRRARADALLQPGHDSPVPG